MDSITPQIKEWYHSQSSVTVIQDPDQYSTDFGKAMKLARGHYKGHEKPKESHPHDTAAREDDDEKPPDQQTPRDVIILGSLSGRVDQGIGLLHEVYRQFQNLHRPSYRIWLVTEQNVSFILPRGTNRIGPLVEEKRNTMGSPLFTEKVGILPLFGNATITTSGLEWDVHRWKTSMGTQVSTSNHVRSDEVVVETSRDVLFTVEICHM